MKAKLLIAIITAAVAGTVQAQINVGVNSITGTDSSVYAGTLNTNAGNNCAIGGTKNNIIAGGSSTVIGGGAYNVAGGLTATIAGGYDNYTVNNAATIGGGYENTVSANYGTIPGGSYAVADKLGQFAYSSGKLSVAGDSQSSLYVLRGTTTSTSSNELSLGTGSIYRMTLGSGAVWSFRALVTAKRPSNGDTKAFEIKGLIKNISGTLTLTSNSETLAADGGASSWAAYAVQENTALVIYVAGQASATISWTATVTTSELN